MLMFHQKPLAPHRFVRNRHEAGVLERTTLRNVPPRRAKRFLRSVHDAADSLYSSEPTGRTAAQTAPRATVACGSVLCVWFVECRQVGRAGSVGGKKFSSVLLEG